ncbi:MAG TPA: TetR/AcrR family transcriptional regulator [Nannocystaceae bacterium]|nr:TetR/AcrR family transcriptional regulator [Nannocystaceae bacterium]
MTESNELVDLRRRILDAAWELGCEHGEAGLTIRRIAERVGISATHLYTYFDGKAALLQELRTRVHDESEARFESIGTLDVAAEQSLCMLCGAYFEFVDRHRWLYRLTGNTDSADLPAHARLFTRHATNILRAHPREACDDHELLAMHVRLAIEGLVWAWRGDELGADDSGDARRVFLDSYFKFLVRGLGHGGAANSGSAFP